jgi:hypothetical protein
MNSHGLLNYPSVGTGLPFIPRISTQRTLSILPASTFPASSLFAVGPISRTRQVLPPVSCSFPESPQSSSRPISWTHDACVWYLSEVINFVIIVSFSHYTDLTFVETHGSLFLISIFSECPCAQAPRLRTTLTITLTLTDLLRHCDSIMSLCFSSRSTYRNTVDVVEAFYSIQLTRLQLLQLEGDALISSARYFLEYIRQRQALITGTS